MVEPVVTTSTWSTRELPILRAVVAAEEAGEDVQAAASAAVPDLSGGAFMKTIARLGMDGFLDVAELRDGSGDYVSVMIRRAMPGALREIGAWPRSATPLEEKRRRRLAFMERLYARTDGDSMARVQAREIGEELRWTEEELFRILGYLSAEGLLEFLAIGGSVAITHLGVVEMEQAIEHPETPTTHFPPIAIINVFGDVVDSQIQAGTGGSSQRGATE